ncbi:hypothetical protein [Candidatus Poriferisodalis sp.]|uniref:hypothetical protein n=1 Tax=Candidatus Poriferisodalis sp. TaxID=3101277 RepID=UPI003B01E2C5
MYIDFRVDGTEAMRGHMSRMRNQAPRRMGLPVARGLAYIALRHAQRTRSFNNITWALRRSMKIVQARDLHGRFLSGYDLLAGGPTAPYGRFLELGTRYIRARLFMLDALVYTRNSVRIAQALGRDSLRDLVRHTRFVSPLLVFQRRR